MRVTSSAIEQLKRDHRIIRDLFNKYEKSDNQDERFELAAMLFRELRLHSALEEEVFYPMLDEKLEDSEIVSEALDEHETTVALIEELESMDVLDAEFNERFLDLADTVLHHIDEEEKEMFQLAGQLFQADDIEQLDSEMAQRRQALIKEIIKESSTRKLNTKHNLSKRKIA